MISEALHGSNPALFKAQFSNPSFTWKQISQILNWFSCFCLTLCWLSYGVWPAWHGIFRLKVSQRGRELLYSKRPPVETAHTAPMLLCPGLASLCSQCFLFLSLPQQSAEDVTVLQRRGEYSQFTTLTTLLLNFILWLHCACCPLYNKVHANSGWCLVSGLFPPLRHWRWTHGLCTEPQYRERVCGWGGSAGVVNQAAEVSDTASSQHQGSSLPLPAGTHDHSNVSPQWLRICVRLRNAAVEMTPVKFCGYCI